MSNRTNTAAYNVTLTNYARGFGQERANALVDFICPTVEVPTSQGKYKSFSDKNAFQVVNTARAVGGPAFRLEFAATDPTYNCQPQSLEIAVDDAEKEASGADDSLGLEKAKVQTLVMSALASMEDKVFAKLAGGVSAVGAAGVWSSSSNDPIAEIDAQIEAITIATGMMPNRLVMGVGAWRAFKNHPKVVDRFPGFGGLSVTSQMAAGLFMNPTIEIRVGTLSKDTSKFGAAKSAVNIVGSQVYVFIGTNEPSLYDPSFAKTFRTTRSGVDGVYVYRDDRNRSDIIALDWSEDTQIVSTDAVRRIVVS